MVGVEDTFGIHCIYPEAKLASMDIISKKMCNNTNEIQREMRKKRKRRGWK